MQILLVLEVKNHISIGGKCKCIIPEGYIKVIVTILQAHQYLKIT
jgi:hypothetical protein